MGVRDFVCLCVCVCMSVYSVCGAMGCESVCIFNDGRAGMPMSVCVLLH